MRAPGDLLAELRAKAGIHGQAALAMRLDDGTETLVWADRPSALEEITRGGTAVGFIWLDGNRQWQAQALLEEEWVLPRLRRVCEHFTVRHDPS